MRALVRSSAAIAATGIAVAALTATPPPPPPLSQALPTVSHDVGLAAVTVPPGGLITSFLGNQLLYCSLICTSAVQGVLTVSAAALQAPAAFVTALQSGDLLKAIGVAAASVTGPATAAAADVIFKDGMVVAPRAVNALETGVVGLLNVIPAAKDGLPGVVNALKTAREDTFTALNLPLVANPEPTVMPKGVLQVAVIGAIDVLTAVFVPALNHILLGVFQVPDAAAQTLARTGDPLQAIAAAAETAATVANNARNAIADAVVTAVNNVRAASGQSPLDAPAGTFEMQESTATPDSVTAEPRSPRSPDETRTQIRGMGESSTATTPDRTTVKTLHRDLTTTEPARAVHNSPGPSDEESATPRHAERGEPHEAGRWQHRVDAASPDDGVHHHGQDPTAGHRSGFGNRAEAGHRSGFTHRADSSRAASEAASDR